MKDYRTKFLLILHKIGIKQKLIAYMLILGIIPATAVGVFLTVEASNDTHENWEARLDVVADLKKDKIIDYFQHLKNDMGVISTNPDFRTHASNENIEGTEEIFNAFLEFRDMYWYLMILDENGSVMAIQANEGYIAPHEYGRDLSDREFFTYVEENQNTSGYLFLSDFRHNFQGKVIINVAAPVYSTEDKFIGVAVGLVVLDAINELMNDATGLGTTGETYLINKDNLFITESRFPAHFPGYETDMEGTLLNSEFVVNSTGVIQAANSKSDIEETTTNYQGSDVLGEYKYMEITSQTGHYWILVAEIDLDEAFAQVNNMIHLIVIIAAIALAIIITSAIIIGKQIADPIQNLTSISKEIAIGHYEVDMDIKARDEVGVLRDNLKIMVDSIVDSLKYTEGIVNALPVGVMAVDKDMKIQLVNDTLIKQTGFQKKDILDQPCAKIFNTRLCNTEKCPIRKAMERDRISDEQDVQIGDLIMQTTGASFKDDEGNMTGGIEILADVTQVRGLTRSVKNIAEEVNTMSEQISESTNQINISVQEISCGAQEMATGAQQQSNQAGHINGSVIKVQNLSQNMVNSSQQISVNSQKGKLMADKGKELTDNLLVRINEITVGAEQVSQTMDSLSDKSKEINKIVDVIAGIATETNLLALNAAIEAARAGEAGKGFAVVAEQVRKLAEDSKQAADQINDLINAIQAEVQDAVSSTNNTVIAIQDGKGAIEGTKTQLDKLFQIIDLTDKGIISTIESIENQDSHIGEIGQSVENINAVIQQSSGTAQELSSSTEEMASSIEEMTAATQELNAAADRLFSEIQKIQ